ncbi:hypothetical protein M2336_002762 [Sphingobium sp. B1D7B]|uniref:PEPxxWA-CTERM sorting domain-containing protein n=1 Tax=unclassified Sphingobium TaxID=2611147 RepID=UPI0022257197|nr:MULTISPECIES: PEPxxWA-CTERM sorting domain-containing protein [unclassified Sphingobium]MCW2387859.1 hypothetical protein [Sphingobium sp. B11D3B]MCW2390924.1 hypothetical protein [Sphingobium sp. B11D3A]MCW2394389.1 hypothetical protein [Sphingobium sp. B8D3B]MCW2406133.1 hypothetical protein [Sphingobium sp. B1D7B]MCW2412051.1 hypothetical protein [Sphingobium sp. B8D3D]
MRKSLLAAASLGAMLLAAAPASAAVTFTLDDVNFVGGGALTGSFTTSNDLSTLLDFSISTTKNNYGFFGNFPGDTYTLADALGFTWSSTLGLSASFLSPISSISLVFASPLTADGTSLALSNETVVKWNGGTRFALSGSVSPVAAPVPEPATWMMLIGGFAIAGTMMRRRRTTVSFA